MTAGPTLRTPDAMRALACNSYSAFYRLCARLGLHAYAPGRYRRQDVEAAMARPVLARQRAVLRGKAA